MTKPWWAVVLHHQSDDVHLLTTFVAQCKESVVCTQSSSITRLRSIMMTLMKLFQVAVALIRTTRLGIMRHRHPTVTRMLESPLQGTIVTSTTSWQGLRAAPPTTQTSRRVATMISRLTRKVRMRAWTWSYSRVRTTCREMSMLKMSTTLRIKRSPIAIKTCSQALIHRQRTTIQRQQLLLIRSSKLLQSTWSQSSV